MKITLTTMVMLLNLFVAFAQQNKLPVHTTAEKFKTFNRTASTVREGGSAVVKVNEADGPGIVWLTGKQFTEGTIEVDIKGKNQYQQSFVGIAFHGENDTTYEAVYFRPFNFRTTDAVRKLHAVQYIANPQFDWPKLRADFPNQYEKPVDPAPDPDQWFHVRLQVHGGKISVFVNGSKLPALAVEQLVNRQGKMIGYWVGNGSAGSWKNLKVIALK